MALVERMNLRDRTPRRDGDVILGEDFLASGSAAEGELHQQRARRGIFSLKNSPLTRKIIIFNLIALNILVAGILLMNSSREPLAVQRVNSLLAEASLVANTFEVRAAIAGLPGLSSDDAAEIGTTLEP